MRLRPGLWTDRNQWGNHLSRTRRAFRSQLRVPAVVWPATGRRRDPRSGYRRPATATTPGRRDHLPDGSDPEGLLEPAGRDPQGHKRGRLHTGDAGYLDEEGF